MQAKLHCHGLIEVFYVHLKLHSVKLYIITESHSEAASQLLLQRFFHSSYISTLRQIEAYLQYHVTLYQLKRLHVSKYTLSVVNAIFMGNHKRNRILL